MYRLLVCLLVLVGCSCGGCTCDCEGQERPTFGRYYNPTVQPVQPAFSPNRKVDGSVVSGVYQYNAGRMAELPQGANRLQLWVVVSPNWRNSQTEYRLCSWFTSGQPNERNQARSPDPRLRKMQDECAWNYYESSNPLFAESGLIQAVGTATPIVCLTKPDGQVLVYLNQRTLSQVGSPGELADLLNAGIEQANPPPKFEGQTSSTAIIHEQDCPDGQCVPTVPPVNTPPPSIEGTLGGEVVPVRNTVNTTAEIILGGLGIAAMVLLAYIRR